MYCGTAAVCVFCLPPSQPIVDRTSNPSSSHARHQLAPIGPDDMNPERDGANLYHPTPGVVVATRQRHGSHPVPLPPLSTAVPLLSLSLSYGTHLFTVCLGSLSHTACAPFPRRLNCEPSCDPACKKSGPLHCLLLLLACTWSLLRTRNRAKNAAEILVPRQVAPHLFFMMWMVCRCEL